VERKTDTIVIYGDSISTTSFGGGGYEKLLKDNLNTKKIYNHAISASGMAKPTPGGLVTLLEDEKYLHKDADLAIIWHGTNDWYWGAELGEAGKADENTFIGALEISVRKIREYTPQIKIIYLTPLYRCQVAVGCTELGEAYINKNIVGNTLKDYYDAITEASKRLCFPLVDMRTATNFNTCNSSVYMPDDVHPSKEGYEIIADILSNSIKLLYLKI